ncbi:MAG TPA: YfiR family protein [Thermoguttaceae bacterium]|nr:YfiR family protein [Thermoguttaceae bacterium]
MNETLRETRSLHGAASRDRCVPRCWTTTAAGVLVIALMLMGPLSTVEAAGVEAKVKSAYLYNLLRRTIWPDKAFQNEESPYRVAVLGQDNLEGLLEKIAQMKKVNKRAIKLERLNSLKDYRPEQPFHMLYVPGYLTPEQQQAVIDKTAGAPCLIVGESPGFAAAGATANFIDRDDGTIGIELNLAQAKKRSLEFDRQLLEVAQTVSE